MLRIYALVAFAGLFAAPVSAGEVTEAGLNDALALGRVATLAPLCTLRDQSWSADLRRSTIQSETGTAAHDDAALKAAPDSDLVIGALSSAEHEALEDLAEDSPKVTCRQLAIDPALPRADAMVTRFRAGLPAS